MVSTGSYQPTGVDTFNIGLHKTFCLVQACSTLPRTLYPLLLSFAVVYSPIGVALLVEENTTAQKPIFAVYQDGDRVDLGKALALLTQLESGWQMAAGVIYSPSEGSTLDLAAVESILSRSQNPSIEATSSEAGQNLMRVG